ncbi:serine/threonine-protein kinase gin4 [Neonectria magnoliae]|uniref:non-specific serine/threonine protein kinase n=1 Tax=Neonectria magnoliae TaxID=2732573 RepID=A0ABR1HCW6_9HYPO
MADPFVSTATRSPLSEASNRINSAYPPQESHRSKSRYDHSVASEAPNSSRPHYEHSSGPSGSRASVPITQPAASRSQAATELKPPQEVDDPKRLSQASHDSSASNRSKKNYKTHIGPWQLGKTLGKGSSARVRLCRHNLTNQLAAVKIVNRRMAYLVHDSSLAALTKWDNSLPDQTGEMRVPMAIEREVAILKLIEHPNIMKLYDIWENRSEVYLILEYIDQGDLFTFINMRGRLSEEVAIYFFRQIISAISYCHSFNICHRDLKPENILITADLQIKIADFGMAALHQTDTHQLATACGSPHYAAPELLKNRQYRGDRADIWSLGVILFAMLSASLPFDDPDLRVMMSRTKRGQYQMPDILSPEAEDLIRRMLQVNPDRRITLKEIWKHPLLQKYSYLDNLGQTNGQPPDTRKGFQYTPVPPQDVDPQLLRQLRSMWHMFSESDLKLKLTCDQANDQKAFYWLLFNYREKQLEDFKPELAHSMSDYHHLKPGAWKKRTREFSQPRLNGHGRSISRFTVISNVAETDPEVSHLLPGGDGQSQKSYTKGSVHRHHQTASASYAMQASRSRNGSGARRGRMTAARTSTTGRLQSSRGSVSSVHSIRLPTPHSRSLRHKRGVDFSNIRKRSSSFSRVRSGPVPPYVTEQGSTHQVEMDRSPTPDVPSLPSGILLKPGHSNTVHVDAVGNYPAQVDPPHSYPVHEPQSSDTPVHSKPARKPVQGPVIDSKHVSEMFVEELRHFSSNIAKDCDDAFGSSLIEDESIAGSLTECDRKQRDATPFCLTIETADRPINGRASEHNTTNQNFNSRPLPPLPPPEVDYAHSLAPTIDSRPTSREDHIGTALPVILTKHTDRRVVSAPVYTNRQRKPTGLPPINETRISTDKARIVSAPPHTPTKKGAERDSGMEYLSRVENSIRVVDSPSGQSPVKAPKPLNVRKKIGDDVSGLNPHPNSAYNPGRGDETAPAANNTSHEMHGLPKKKKSSWFRRSYKGEGEASKDSADWQDCSSIATSSEGKRSDSTSTGAATKRKTFSFPFWKSHKPRDSGMSIGKPGDVDNKESLSSEAQVTSRRVSHGKTVNTKLNESGSCGVRNIEVKQSWLARLFRVKPATSHLCMVISRRRARREIAILLREWRKYGIRGIQVDKQRNIVFARVAADNYLELKEVSFAAEVMTVIEHGKKQQLSIVRFTQERGAASSFHRVVDTLKLVFETRGLVVMDRNKEKMMMATLNS